MTPSPAITISGLTFHYGSRCALDKLALDIAPSEIFAFVGPNGGGKTTLFRLLSTLVPLQAGDVSILGHDLRGAVRAVRRQIGVVFQAASLDKKLTVAENLRHQGHLYGMRGVELAQRQQQMLEQLGVANRRDDFAETLSGGLRRRVELAKGLLHRPQLLLLDEPSTGLDPAARRDLWEVLETLRRDEGVTIVLTTHLLDEAEKADRIAILNEGSLVALDTPDALRATVGGDAITIQTKDCAGLAESIRERFSCRVEIIEGTVRLEQPDGHQWIARLVEAFPGVIDSITFARPTLEDVFIDRTGQGYRQDMGED